MEYYNIEKSLTAAKNDCDVGVIGTSVTLTANANQFVSTVSVEDANAKADAWLAANVQAYANNSGTCRTTAWRGINPSCLLEPETTLSPFDYMVVRYKWALGAGSDFDTYTGIVNTGITSLDKKWMGWGHQMGNEIPAGALPENCYILWAGDNTQANGIEACLVNFSNIIEDYPSLNTVQIRMAGSWFSSKGTGNVEIEITTYLGGKMIKDGYNIVNDGGGHLVQQLTFSKNIAIAGQNLANNIEAVTNIGYITYSKNQTGQIVITY